MKLYKDFLRANFNNLNDRLKRDCFENVVCALRENGYQNIVDDVFIEKALDDIEKGYILANGESDFVAYYKKGSEYYAYNSYYKTKEITTRSKIERHIKSDSYEIQRYFDIYLDNSEL